MLAKIMNYLAALAATAILMVCVSLVQARMDAIVKESRLVDLGFVEKGAPPVVSFTTVALGSFRGLIADVLWIRSSSLQDQGKYFEMVQLASWITKLQPRFTGATAFLAWNMAYNISVTFSSPVDRYRWVQRGIELIRDEALAYNPSDPVLYKELGWIYQHKLGNVMDDAQLYYKYEMAKTYMKVFGGPDADWGSLAASPKDDRAFKKAFPESDPLWQALSNAGFRGLQELSQKFRESGSLPESVAKELKDPATLKALESYLRASWLRQVYRLEPEVVLSINVKYGKLDWRLPESHSIYWATMGLDRSPNKESVDCDRMITQSLYATFQAGKMIMPGGESASLSTDFMTVPNLNVVDAVRQSYLDAMAHNSNVSTFKSALEFFMTEAVVTLYSFGQYSKAKEYYGYLGKEYPNEKFKKDFDQFVLDSWLEIIKDATFKQGHDLISALIFRSCLFTAYGEQASAEAHLKLAKLAYKKYETNYKASLARIGLPPFDKMKAEIAKNCLQSFPPNMAKLLQAQINMELIESGKAPMVPLNPLKPFVPGVQAPGAPATGD